MPLDLHERLLFLSLSVVMQVLYSVTPFTSHFWQTSFSCVLLSRKHNQLADALPVGAFGVMRKKVCVLLMPLNVTSRGILALT